MSKSRIAGGFPPFLEVGFVAKPELGNKHQCQNCGARFFDLNKSPVRCPKCETVCQDTPLPLVAHHAAGSRLRAKSRFRTAAVADDEKPPAGAETVLVSLDEADAGEDKVAVVADAHPVWSLARARLRRGDAAPAAHHAQSGRTHANR